MYIFQRYEIKKQIERRTFSTDTDGKVSWEEFKKDYIADDGMADEDSREQMKEDKEKFKYADEDGDGKLDLKEYMASYHPGVR